MKNIKKEFLNHLKDVNCNIPSNFNKRPLVGDRRIKCIFIRKDKKISYLPLNYTQSDYEQFLEEIDFDYEPNSDCMTLIGNIWFDDDTWSERVFRGKKWEEWVYYRVPDIPFLCSNPPKKEKKYEVTNVEIKYNKILLSIEFLPPFKRIENLEIPISDFSTKNIENVIKSYFGDKKIQDLILESINKKFDEAFVNNLLNKG